MRDDPPTAVATTRTDELLAAILDAVEKSVVAVEKNGAELRALRADMRRGRQEVALRDALEDEFGGGAFTVAGLLEIARTEPENPITHVLSDLIDPTLPERNRATQLGRLLGQVSWLAVEGEKRGSAMYYLIGAEVVGSPPQGSR